MLTLPRSSPRWQVLILCKSAGICIKYDKRFLILIMTKYSVSRISDLLRKEG